MSLSKTQASALEAAVAKFNASEDESSRMAALQEYDSAFSKRAAELDAELTNSAQDSADAAALAKLEDEEKHLLAELEALTKDEGDITGGTGKVAGVTASGKAKASDVRLKEYFEFASARASVNEQLAVIKASLNSFVEHGGRSVVGEWRGKALLVDDIWAEEQIKLQKAIEAVNAAKQAVPSTLQDVDTDTAATSSLFTEIQELRTQAQETVKDSEEEEEANKEAKLEFHEERGRILIWCRQQRTNLDAMVEPDHVQEFCASLLNNFPTMEENFEQLLTMADPFMADESIQQGLLESNEVWLSLQVATYDRLRHTLLEIHPKSKLEDEVREFSSFSTRVGEFLETFSDLLAGPSDPESQQYVQPVVEQCEAIREEYGMHATLTKQLHDFSTRMESLRESYTNLRRAVLSRLTFLTSAVPALTASMRRKEEYVARLKDLKKWVEVKSQGETWKDINSRIQSIKSLIEREQQTLQDAKRERDATGAQ